MSVNKKIYFDCAMISKFYILPSQIQLTTIVFPGGATKTKKKLKSSEKIKCLEMQVLMCLAIKLIRQKLLNLK